MELDDASWGRALVLVRELRDPAIPDVEGFGATDLRPVDLHARI
ncbi:MULTISPECIES: hypothetical protein [Micromonospora]|nr:MULTISPECIES: hypothetical protein [unclassified Micromonospora]